MWPEPTSKLLENCIVFSLIKYGLCGNFNLFWSTCRHGQLSSNEIVKPDPKNRLVDGHPTAISSAVCIWGFAFKRQRFLFVKFPYTHNFCFSNIEL